MTDTAAFGIEAPNRSALRAPDNRARAFAEAARHSRRVRFLRKAIPLSIVGTVFFMVFGRLLNPFTSTFPDVSVSSVGIEGSKLTMEQPKLSGFKKDNKAYEVVAESAAQDIRKPSIVELKAPIARIEMQKGQWVRLAATSGIYDSTTEKLVVTDRVTIKSDSGLDMRMSEANVDFKAGTMASAKPVEVDLPDGWVKSDRMNVTDNGKTIIFEGQVRSEIRAAMTPQSDAAPAPKETPAQ